MFKKLILCMFMFSSFSAFAAGDDWTFGSIFSQIDSFFTIAIDFFSVDIPDFIDRLFAYLVEFIIYMKVTILIYSVESAFSVAKLILADVGFIQLVEKFAGNLPADIRNAAVELKIFQAFNLIVEAYLARFVLAVL
jgi:hypothetical protein